MPAPLSQDQFIQRAKQIHDNKYDYSKSIYVRGAVHVTIGCPTHGDFPQRAYDHLRNSGCPKCGREKIGKTLKFTKEEFIDRAKLVHRTLYDYTEVSYINSNTKIEIICKNHGSFLQYPSDHLRKSGCPQCSGGKKRNTQTFIIDAKEIHGDIYDYSLVEFKNVHTNVKIICQIHGEFQTLPKLHLSNKRGCPMCSKEKCTTRRRKTMDAFLAEAKEIHGDTYNYEKVIYKTTDTPVSIVCKEHGEFNQRPSNHLYGANCPKCVKGKGKGLGGYSDEYFINHILERNIPAMIYVTEITCNDDRFYKLGITKNDLKSRYQKGRIPEDANITPIIEHKTTLFNAFLQEQYLLRCLHKHRYFPNIKFPGHTECLKANDFILNILNRHFGVDVGINNNKELTHGQL